MGQLGGPFSDKVRYKEESFDANEQVAILGKVVEYMGERPEYGRVEPQLMVVPCVQSDLSDQFFEEQGWSFWERQFWEALTRDGQLIGTDDRNFMKGIIIPPLNATRAQFNRQSSNDGNGGGGTGEHTSAPTPTPAPEPAPAPVDVQNGAPQDEDGDPPIEFEEVLSGLSS